MRSRVETPRTDQTIWEVGPYAEMLPGPMIIRFILDGEIVVSCDTETGFAHKGLEKAIELHPWSSAIIYSDHVDPDAAVFGELALCSAVEEICQLEVSPRAQAVRLLLSELTRVCSHLLFIAKTAASVGAETMVHYVLRDRERVLDLFELITGARFSVGFLRYGGVCANITEGFVERVLEISTGLRERLGEYDALFTSNEAFRRRAAGVAVLSPEMIAAHGVTGPCARASGVDVDFRREGGALSYQALELPQSLLAKSEQAGGDVLARYFVRLFEISRSVEILAHLAGHMPDGEFQGLSIGKDFEPPAGEAYARVESPRGLLSCHVSSAGGAKPLRVQFRTPSLFALRVIPQVLAGIHIEDVPMALASLDLSIAEADR